MMSHHWWRMTIYNFGCNHSQFWRLEHVQVPEDCKDLDQYDNDDQQSLKSIGNVIGPVHKRHQQLAHDLKSLDSISITSGFASSDFAIIDKVQSTEGTNQNLSKSVTLSHPNAAADAVSILSVGEIADIPWSDIPALELTPNKTEASKQVCYLWCWLVRLCYAVHLSMLWYSGITFYIDGYIPSLLIFGWNVEWEAVF